MQVQICWTESRCAAVISACAKILWFPGTCLWRVQSMFDQGISAMVGQPGAVSVLQENCNQRSIGRGKWICKLMHHTPGYSLNKHWKLSVWAAVLRYNTHPICWAKQIFTSKAGAKIWKAFFYHCGHLRQLYICTGILELSAVCGKGRERQEVKQQMKDKRRSMNEYDAYPSARYQHPPPVERNVFFTSLRACLPDNPAGCYLKGLIPFSGSHTVAIKYY